MSDLLSPKDRIAALTKDAAAFSHNAAEGLGDEEDQ